MQRDEQWFKNRAGKETASRFPDMMSKTRSGAPAATRANWIAQLAVERLTGMPAETYSNAAMQRGTDMEPIARAAYEAHTGQLVELVDFVIHRELPFVGCSPDGLVGDDGLVEIKCPSSMAKHADYLLKGSHVQEYWWQIQGQMWICERQWLDMVSFDPRFPEHLQLAIRRVERDEKAIESLFGECVLANEEIEVMVTQLKQLEK